MAPDVTPATARGALTLQLDEQVVRMLREHLPQVATHTVAAVTAEVPGYTGALGGEMGENIGAAVQMALAGFLKLAAGARDADPSTPLGPTLDGAYDLGRGEARNGRTIDALLAAYRVGARVAWRDMAALAAQAGVEASTMAQFAELVFAYIDELSAASVAGHTDELSTSGRVRERYRERLSQHLLDGAGPDVLAAAAERAGWTPPTTLTAVLVPSAQLRGVLASLDPGHPRRGRGPAGRRGRQRAPALPAPGPRCGWHRSPAPAAGARRTAGRARSGPAVVAGSLVVRPGGSHRGDGPEPATGRSTARTTSPSSSSAPTRMRWPTCEPGRSRRWTTCGPPAGSDSRRRCGPGCCTRAAGTRSPPSCTCTRRRCATGWASCASCTATGSTTRRRCSTSCSRSAAERRAATQVRPTGVDGVDMAVRATRRRTPAALDLGGRPHRDRPRDRHPARCQRTCRGRGDDRAGGPLGRRGHRGDHPRHGAAHRHRHPGTRGLRVRRSDATRAGDRAGRQPGVARQPRERRRPRQVRAEPAVRRHAWRAATSDSRRSATVPAPATTAGTATSGTARRPSYHRADTRDRNYRCADDGSTPAPA